MHEAKYQVQITQKTSHNNINILTVIAILIIAGQKQIRNAEILSFLGVLLLADHVIVHLPHPDTGHLLAPVVRRIQVRDLAIHSAHAVQVPYQSFDSSFFPLNFSFPVQQVPDVNFKLGRSGPHAEILAQLAHVQVNGEEGRCVEPSGNNSDVLDVVVVTIASVEPHDDCPVVFVQMELELPHCVYGDVIDHLYNFTPPEKLTLQWFCLFYG